MSQDEPQNVDLLYDEATIHEKIEDLGRVLTGDLGEKALLVSLLNASVLVVADLVRAIRRRLRFEFVQVEMSRQDPEGEIVKIEYPVPFEVKGADLLLIRDLTTTGVIESYLVQQFQQLGAERVQVASLMDIPERRTTDFEPDYRLFSLKNEVGTLVGYGLKADGRFGNLPYLGQLL